MNVSTFIEDFLSHEYDPVKAREYYLRTRKLKGRKVADKEFKEMNKKDAQKTLNADLKKSKVKMNPKRRIGAAEQKLIRAKSLASRIQDKKLRASMLKKLAATEKKLRATKVRLGVLDKASNRTGTRGSGSKPNPKSAKDFYGKPLKKLGSRMEEDQTPGVSATGAKLDTFDQGPHGLGRATYSDGSVYDAKTGWSKPKRKSSK